MKFTKRGKRDMERFKEFVEKPQALKADRTLDPLSGRREAGMVSTRNKRYSTTIHPTKIWHPIVMSIWDNWRNNCSR